LHKAVVKGSVVLVKFLLLENGADASIQDNNGRYPLHLVRGSNSEEMLKLLLRTSMRYINTVDNFGYTPINYLALSGDVACVQLLISNDAFLTNFNKKNITVTKKLYEHISSFDKLLQEGDSRYKSQMESLINNMKQEMIAVF